jgi:hypothetical protein
MNYGMAWPSRKTSSPSEMSFHPPPSEKRGWLSGLASGAGSKVARGLRVTKRHTAAPSPTESHLARAALPSLSNERSRRLAPPRDHRGRGTSYHVNIGAGTSWQLRSEPAMAVLKAFPASAWTGRITRHRPTANPFMLRNVRLRRELQCHPRDLKRG